jgi:lysine/ornithine N-monooxygenase
VEEQQKVIIDQEIEDLAQKDLQDLEEEYCETIVGIGKKTDDINTLNEQIKETDEKIERLERQKEYRKWEAEKFSHEIHNDKYTNEEISELKNDKEHITGNIRIMESVIEGDKYFLEGAEQKFDQIMKEEVINGLQEFNLSETTLGKIADKVSDIAIKVCKCFGIFSENKQNEVEKNDKTKSFVETILKSEKEKQGIIYRS